MTSPIIRVALDVPLMRSFDYLASDAREDDVGRRVGDGQGRELVHRLVGRDRQRRRQLVRDFLRGVVFPVRRLTVPFTERLIARPS